MLLSPGYLTQTSLVGSVCTVFVKPCAVVCFVSKMFCRFLKSNVPENLSFTVPCLWYRPSVVSVLCPSFEFNYFVANDLWCASFRFYSGSDVCVLTSSAVQTWNYNDDTGSVYSNERSHKNSIAHNDTPMEYVGTSLFNYTFRNKPT